MEVLVVEGDVRVLVAGRLGGVGVVDLERSEIRQRIIAIF